jgi:predicted nucleic acid-binding protein
VGAVKIYLDCCCYNRPFDNQAQIKIRLETEAKLYIQASVRKGEHALTWSYMLDYENNENPYEDKRNAIALWKDIAEVYCPSSEDILSLGRNIMGQGAAEKDALHIACALKSGCAYFITTDAKLLKKHIKGISIINPIDFVRKVEA